MKKYLLIVLLVGVGLGENLTFINSKDTIVFKYKDLININQERFRFLNKDGDIINLTKEYMFKSMESKSGIVKMNVNEIKSFQSYERFRLSNAMDKSKSFRDHLGFFYAILGIGIIYTSDIKNDYKFFSAILAAGSNGLFGASLGYFYGGIYGFLSYGEGDMNFVENGNWKIQ
tara:strand:+ start:108 stop:626 length:519 start_codon:yes stop_codon:yes gene_type:complete